MYKIAVIAVHLKKKPAKKIKHDDILGYRIADIETHDTKDVTRDSVERMVATSIDRNLHMLKDISRYTLIVNGKLYGEKKPVAIKNGSSYKVLGYDGQGGTLSSDELEWYVKAGNDIANMVYTGGRCEELKLAAKDTQWLSREELEQERRNAFSRRYAGIHCNVSKNNSSKLLRSTYFDLYKNKCVRTNSMLRGIKEEYGIDSGINLMTNRDNEIIGLEDAVYPINKHVIFSQSFVLGPSSYISGTVIICRNTWVTGYIEFTATSLDNSSSLGWSITLNDIAREYRLNGSYAKQVEINGDIITVHTLIGDEEYSLSANRISLEVSEAGSKYEVVQRKRKVLGAELDTEMNANNIVTSVQCNPGQILKLPEGAYGIGKRAIKGQKVYRGTYALGSIVIPAGIEVDKDPIEPLAIRSIDLIDIGEDKQCRAVLTKALGTDNITAIKLPADIHIKTLIQIINTISALKPQWMDTCRIELRSGINAEMLEAVEKEITAVCRKKINDLKIRVKYTGYVHDDFHIPDISRLKIYNNLAYNEDYNSDETINGAKASGCDMAVSTYTKENSVNGLIAAAEYVLGTKLAGREKITADMNALYSEAVNGYRKRICRPVKKIYEYTARIGRIVACRGIWTLDIDGLYIDYHIRDISGSDADSEREQRRNPRMPCVMDEVELNKAVKNRKLIKVF